MKDYVAKILYDSHIDKSNKGLKNHMKETDDHIQQLSYHKLIRQTFAKASKELTDTTLDPIPEDAKVSISWADIQDTIHNANPKDYEGIQFTDSSGGNREQYEDYIKEWLQFNMHKTSFWEDTGIYFVKPIHVWGEHVSLIDYYICPHCGTIIETHDDCIYGDVVGKPFMCPTCYEKDGGKFKEGFWWKYWTTNSEGYATIKNMLNWHIDWDKKYYFRIGMKDYGKPFHIGKWYPKIPKYYKYNDKKWIMGTFYLGFYPYQTFLHIKRFPTVLKFWYEKNFQKEIYNARMNRLFPDRIKESVKVS
jgi:hypothetical protein